MPQRKSGRRLGQGCPASLSMAKSAEAEKAGATQHSPKQRSHSARRLPFTHDSVVWAGVSSPKGDHNVGETERDRPLPACRRDPQPTRRIAPAEGPHPADQPPTPHFLTPRNRPSRVLRMPALRPEPASQQPILTPSEADTLLPTPDAVEPDEPSRSPRRRGVAVGGPERAVDIRPGLAAKLDACPAYGSQLGFQFDRTQQMRAMLTELATAEARRLHAAGPAEVLRGDASALEQLVHPGDLGRQLAGVARPDVGLEHERDPR